MGGSRVEGKRDYEGRRGMKDGRYKESVEMKGWEREGKERKVGKLKR